MNEQFQRVVLDELAALHAQVAYLMEITVAMFSQNKATPSEKVFVLRQVAEKQQALYAHLCQRAGIEVKPESPSDECCKKLREPRALEEATRHSRPGFPYSGRV